MGGRWDEKGKRRDGGEMGWEEQEKEGWRGGGMGRRVERKGNRMGRRGRGRRDGRKMR